MYPKDVFLLVLRPALLASLLSFEALRTPCVIGWPLRFGQCRPDFIHLFLLDLGKRNFTGKDADAALGRAHITVNKNAVPNDPRPPAISSGLRIGTPAVTTRGFKEAEIRQLTGWIADVLDHMGDEGAVERVRAEVVKICRRFPVYG